MSKAVEHGFVHGIAIVDRESNKCVGVTLMDRQPTNHDLAELAETLPPELEARLATEEELTKAQEAAERWDWRRPLNEGRLKVELDLIPMKKPLNESKPSPKAQRLADSLIGLGKPLVEDSVDDEEDTGVTPNAETEEEIEGVHSGDDKYEVIIDYKRSGPGKFEGEGNVGEWLWQQSLDGFNEDLGDSETFGWYGLLLFDKPILVRDDGDGWTFQAAIVSTGSTGFVDTETFDTAEEAQARWSEIAVEYEEFEAEGEEDDEPDGEVDDPEQDIPGQQKMPFAERKKLRNEDDDGGDAYGDPEDVDRGYREPEQQGEVDEPEDDGEPLTAEQIKQILGAVTVDVAEAEGAKAGKAAGNSFFDGNTSAEEYASVLKGIEDGDPAVLDALPTLPVLDKDAVFRDLCSTAAWEKLKLELDDADYEALSAADENLVVVAYADAYRDAAQDEIERWCRNQLSTETKQPEGPTPLSEALGG